MNIYVYDYGHKIGLKQNTIYVEKDGKIIADYPIEKVDSITLSTESQITSQCIETLIEKNCSIT